MITRAVRLYGKKDLRLEEFELPPISRDEILARVITDSICMSTHKAAVQGEEHKRVPANISSNPVMIGHEFAGEIVEVGEEWRGKFSPGDKFSIQPAINYEDGPMGILSAPGYSYPYIGGDASYVIIPREVMKQDCLLEYKGPAYYPASLSEPLSCVIGAMHASYHTKPGSYIHNMGIVDGGRMAILAGAGPMGLAAINYVLERKDRRPSLLVVTDIDRERLERAERLYTPEYAAKKGLELKYLDTSAIDKPVEHMKRLAGGQGFNDVFIFAPVASVIEQGDAILAFDGCLNFFAGPSDPDFKAPFNFYNAHYNYTHIAGTSGGNNNDMKEALEIMEAGFDPAGLVTHIGGLNAVIDTTLDLPTIPGGKKLIYTHIDMPLIAIEDLEELGSENRLYAELAEITARHKGLWSVEAEEYLLSKC